MRVCEFVIVSTRVSVTRASTHSPTYPPTYTQYQNFVIRSASEHRDILVKFVKSVELLKPLGGEQLIALSRAFQQKVFAAGETVIEQGPREDIMILSKYHFVMVFDSQMYVFRETKDFRFSVRLMHFVMKSCSGSRVPR